MYVGTKLKPQEEGVQGNTDQLTVGVGLWGLPHKFWIFFKNKTLNIFKILT